MGCWWGTGCGEDGGRLYPLDGGPRRPSISYERDHRLQPHDRVPPPRTPRRGEVSDSLSRSSSGRRLEVGTQDLRPPESPTHPGTDLFGRRTVDEERPQSSVYTTLRTVPPRTDVRKDPGRLSTGFPLPNLDRSTPQPRTHVSPTFAPTPHPPATLGPSTRNPS